MSLSPTERAGAFGWPDGIRAGLSLTFDDARLSQVDVGIPVLDAHGVRGTFYLSLQNAELRAQEWNRAAAAGHEIGNHTLTHPCSGSFAFSRSNALEDYTLDGIENEIDPGEPMDIDLFENGASDVQQVPGSLSDVLDCLEEDHAFLLKGGVFTEDLLDTYIDWKRVHDVDVLRLRPHPIEYVMYYDI